MSEVIPAVVPVVKPEPTPTPAPVVKPELDPVPYARFSEVNAEKKALELKLEEIATKAEADRVAKLEKDGQHSTIIAEQQAKLDELQKIADQKLLDDAARLTTLRSKLPEDKRDRYNHITDVATLETLVEDFNVTGGNGPGYRPGATGKPFGGYESETAFANADLVGYAKYAATESRQAIPWGVQPE